MTSDGSKISGRRGLRLDRSRVVVYGGLLILVLAVAGMRIRERFRFEIRRASFAPYDDLFEPLDATSWRLNHKEETGQTLGEFKRVWKLRPEGRLTTIYVQPLGPFGETGRRVLDNTMDLLGRVFQLPVRELPVLGLDAIPDSARRTGADPVSFQLHTKFILDEVLRPNRPDDAAAMIIFTMSDLWPGPGWNFVFGQASLNERIGVWSLARFGDPDAGPDARRRFAMRTFKVAVHETGHIFAMPHCITFRCGMNGSNGLVDTDAAPLAFCPECSAKMLWASGADPEEWYRGLADFAEAHGLDAEGERWRRAGELAADLSR